MHFDVNRPSSTCFAKLKNSRRVIAIILVSTRVREITYRFNRSGSFDVKNDHRLKLIEN